MKIAVNRCFGGFALSDAVFEFLISRGWKVTKYDDEGKCEDSSCQIVDTNKHFMNYSRYSFVNGTDDGCRAGKYRANPDLIEAIETLGEEANGGFGDIRVVEIPDDVEWEIDDYDGLETIHERHRSW